MAKTKQDRVIYHIDCNGFFASVEESLNPELRKVPMAVCGDPQSRHGIILAKNELAKAYHIKTAETIWQAKKKCPHLLLVPVRHNLYGKYCERINAIYGQYTARVERFGIDESFLDVTGSLHLFGGDKMALAHEIRKRVPRETGVSVSVGVSFNKIFAKLASDMKKPNAVTLLDRLNFREIAWPLPASSLLMVGRSTEKTLHSMRIHTIGDLANASETALRRRFGKMGEQLYAYANGRDESPVQYADVSEAPRSVGNGLTFRRNLVTQEDIVVAVTALSDRVATRLRRLGLKATVAQVTIKDTNMKVITRQKTLEYPSCSLADIVRAAMELITTSWKIGVPIRMITITVQKLIAGCEVCEQMSFFHEPEQLQNRARREQLERAIDYLRCRYGKHSVLYGCVMHNDLGICGSSIRDD